MATAVELAQLGEGCRGQAASCKTLQMETWKQDKVQCQVNRPS